VRKDGENFKEKRVLLTSMEFQGGGGKLKEKFTQERWGHRPHKNGRANKRTGRNMFRGKIQKRSNKPSGNLNIPKVGLEVGLNNTEKGRGTEIKGGSP